MDVERQKKLAFQVLTDEFSFSHHLSPKMKYNLDVPIPVFQYPFQSKLFDSRDLYLWHLKMLSLRIFWDQKFSRHICFLNYRIPSGIFFQKFQLTLIYYSPINLASTQLVIILLLYQNIYWIFCFFVNHTAELLLFY